MKKSIPPRRRNISKENQKLKNNLRQDQACMGSCSNALISCAIVQRDSADLIYYLVSTLFKICNNHFNKAKSNSNCFFQIFDPKLCCQWFGRGDLTMEESTSI